MYDTLVEYAEERKAIDGEWDGNVPANYKTGDVPPKALGRWINRQRTLHQKHKLKAEFADKLNTLGLKWSVHSRPSILPMSQLPTPVKSNVTIVAAPRTALSKPPGPIAAAAARLAASKVDADRPDAVTSNTSVSATAKRPDAVTLNTSVSATAKPNSAATAATKSNEDASKLTVSATTKATSDSNTVAATVDVAVMLHPAVRAAASALPSKLALSVPTGHAEQIVPTPTVTVSNPPPKEGKETTRDATPSDATALLASEKLVKTKACADDDPAANPILPMKRVGHVHVGK